MFSDDELIAGIESQDVRAITRLITLCENRVPRAREILARLPEPSGKTHIIGITGSPGAGKSSLVDQIVAELANRKKSVAVLAIDPSSPYSGGAVLGDRIRMTTALVHKEVFVRSMATRGALGGISRGTHDALSVLEAAGYEYIIVETVGVGQAEVDIVRSADTCVVVLVPGMGDSVQALKAGILEIADLFVINKSDLSGADILEKDIRILLGLAMTLEGDWEPTIDRTVATKGEGIVPLLDGLDKHKEWLHSSDFGGLKRRDLVRHRLLHLLIDSFREEVEEQHGELLASLADQVILKKIHTAKALQTIQLAVSDGNSKRDSKRNS